MSTKSILELSNGDYSCQFYANMPHDEQASLFKKYKIERTKDFLITSSRGIIKLKPFENIAKKTEIQKGMPVPNLLKYYYDNESSIISQIKNGVCPEMLKDIQIFKSKILQSLPNMWVWDQDFATVYCDGSFDPDTNKGGAAAVIVRKNTPGTIQFSTNISQCHSLTHAEMIALYFSYMMASNYCKITEIKTDSTSSIQLKNTKTEGRMIV